MKRSYMVVYERVADGNWGGWAPDIGGAVGAGDTLNEVRKSLSEGMAIQLEDLATRGIEAPQAVCKSIDFSEFDENPAESHYEIEWMMIDIPEVHTLPANREKIAA